MSTTSKEHNNQIPVNNISHLKQHKTKNPTKHTHTSKQLTSHRTSLKLPPPTVISNHREYDNSLQHLYVYHTALFIFTGTRITLFSFLQVIFASFLYLTRLHLAADGQMVQSFEELCQTSRDPEFNHQDRGKNVVCTIHSACISKVKNDYNTVKSLSLVKSYKGSVL